MTGRVGIDRATEDLLRQLTPHVLGALTRRHGAFDACEDAVQEALLAAATGWPTTGLPDNPRGWLLAVAERRLTDEIRNNTARRRREQAVERLAEPPLDDHFDHYHQSDDTLTLLFLCCHPALAEPSQIALTLHSVAGLSTAQIAAAYLVPEPTMAQRISRAKQRLRQAGATFAAPEPAEAPQRLATVLRVLYLVFNEGYTASSGPSLTQVELTTEAIRLTRELHRLRPDAGEVAGPAARPAPPVTVPWCR